jgi:hypothetical protein
MGAKSIQAPCGVLSDEHCSQIYMCSDAEGSITANPYGFNNYFKTGEEAFDFSMIEPVVTGSSYFRQYKKAWFVI